jgi:hypothetical protein
MYESSNAIATPLEYRRVSFATVIWHSDQSQLVTGKGIWTRTLAFDAPQCGRMRLLAGSTLKYTYPNTPSHTGSVFNHAHKRGQRLEDSSFHTPSSIK